MQHPVTGEASASTLTYYIQTCRLHRPCFNEELQYRQTHQTLEGEQAKELDEHLTSIRKSYVFAEARKQRRRKMDELALEQERARETKQKARELRENARELREKAREIREKARELREKAREIREKAREIKEIDRDESTQAIRCLLAEALHLETLGHPVPARLDDSHVQYVEKYLEEHPLIAARVGVLEPHEKLASADKLSSRPFEFDSAKLEAFSKSLEGYHFKRGLFFWRGMHVHRVHLSHGTIDGVPVAAVEKRLTEYANRSFVGRFIRRWMTDIEEQRDLLLYYYAREYLEVTQALCQPHDTTQDVVSTKLWYLTLTARYETAKAKLLAYSDYKPNRAGDYTPRGISWFSGIRNVLMAFPEKAAKPAVYEYTQESEIVLEKLVGTTERVYTRLKMELADCHDDARQAKTNRIAQVYEDYVDDYYHDHHWSGKSEDIKLQTFLLQARKRIHHVFEERGQYLEGELTTTPTIEQARIYAVRKRKARNEQLEAVKKLNLELQTISVPPEQLEPTVVKVI